MVPSGITGMNQKANMKKLKLKKSRKYLIKKADKLFSQLIHKRMCCQHCGVASKFMDTAHVISRTNKHLRWNEDNALLLCRRCHLYWQHKSPLEYAIWFQNKYPIQYGFLTTERNQIEANLAESIEFTIERLQNRLKEYER